MRYFFLFTLFFSYLHAETVIRVGHFPNLTHAQGILGHSFTRHQEGWFEKYLGSDVKIEWYVYAGGPSAMEAILTDSLDIAFVGPSPSINAYIVTKGKDIRVIAGACSGGSALVVQGIKNDQDFLNKKIASPQLGGTQDVVLRNWLREKGYKVELTGGDVLVIPTENASLFPLFQKHDLDGGWTVEPWVSQLVIEGGGTVYVEESSLWKETEGHYTTTHVVCSKKFLENQRPLLKKWLEGHIALTDWINTHSEEALEKIRKELKEEIHHVLPAEVVTRAWKQLTLTYDPIQLSVFRYAEDAYQIGFLKEKPHLEHLYDLSLLEELTSIKKGK